MFGASGKIMRALTAGDGAPDPETFVVTEGQSGFYTGYSDGTGSPPVIGSVDVGTIHTGDELRSLNIFGLGPSFNVYIEGNHAETFLESVELVGYETVTQADDQVGFNYDAGDDQTEWAFSLAAEHWDGSGTETVILTYG